MGRQYARVGLIQDIFQVFRPEPRIYRYLYRADSTQGKHQKEPFRPIVEPSRDVVACINT